MRSIARSLAGTAAIILLGGVAAPAMSAPACTHESWSIDGSPLAVALCVTTPAPHAIVTETLTREGQSASHTLAFDVLDPAAGTHAIDTIALNDVGSSKSLRLTIVYRGGQATVEHALMLPGAVVLK